MKKENWEICKEFGFDYGHRVWSQKLDVNYSIDDQTVCRHLHGHRGKVFIHLIADKLTNGMCTDFKHLNWAKKFIDDYIDHKFILDLNDPWFVNIINATPKYENNKLVKLNTNQLLNTKDGHELTVKEVYVPGTDHFAGFILDVDELAGPEKEFFEGFFLVDFLPTSENLSKWLFDCVEAKMSLINVTTSKIEWWETPKSCSVYTNTHK